jgi:thiol-disulfide isomerase/thioredoxin
MKKNKKYVPLSMFFTIENMNRQTIITIMLTFVAVLGQAQTKVWNKVVAGYVNVPIISITKVSIDNDRTEVFFHLDVPQEMTGDSIPIAAKPTLRADGKEYAVKGATVISLSEPYKIPVDGKVDFSLIFEPIPANTYMIDVAEPNAWSFANVRDAENLPTGIADTYWRNEATGDWLIGFTPKHVIYDNTVWDIVSQVEKKDAYTLTLLFNNMPGVKCAFYSKALSLKPKVVKVGKLKKGKRTITVDDGKPIVCCPITGTALPDYPTKDTRKGFVDNGYRAGDSVTIIGWLKDMPQDVWQRKGREFQVGMENIFSTEHEQGSAYALMDSLGRFTLKMPLLNTSQAFLDWGRTTKSTVLEPGKTYFFLNDFKTGQALWMGDDVRLQNELLAHPHSWASAEIDRSRRDLAPMTYLAQADSVRQAQMVELKQWVTDHPHLSQRYQDYVAGYYQNILGESMTQASYHFPNYEMPQEYMDFLDKECWQKAIKPYTLYRDFTTFMRDYLREVMRKRMWRVNWNVYDYNDKIASNDEELSLLNRCKDWLIDANAKVEAAQTPEEKQKVAEKLNADNADMLAEVDKILNGPRGKIVVNGVGLVIRMKQEAFALDSLGADQDLKNIWLTRLVNDEINHTHMSLSPMVIDTLKALVTNPVSIAMIEKQSNYYLAIENREFDRLVLKSSDNLKDISEGEALLKKILEPYKGKFVLLDVWGTWCGPCKEALSHSTEEYARLKDYDIQYLYLANGSPQTAWENIIKEYNVSGPNVAHYNLPSDQQAAIEHHLNIHAFPTYKLFDRDGNLLDLKVDVRDLETLAGLLDKMK